MVKLFGDYKEDPEKKGKPNPDWNPHAHLLDLVRRSAHTERLEDQEHFMENMAGIKAGKGKVGFLSPFLPSISPYHHVALSSPIVSLNACVPLPTTTTGPPPYVCASVQPPCFSRSQLPCGSVR